MSIITWLMIYFVRSVTMRTSAASRYSPHPALKESSEPPGYNGPHANPFTIYHNNPKNLAGMQGSTMSLQIRGEQLVGSVAKLEA